MNNTPRIPLMTVPTVRLLDYATGTDTIQEFDTIEQAYTAAYELAETYPKSRVYVHTAGKLSAAYTPAMGWH